MALLTVEGLTKRYGTAVALRDVSLQLRPGEIHALVGENGSGKSTLCSILIGDPEIARTGGWEGRILLDGVPVRFAGPADALAAGVGLVHQELSLVDGLSVADNIALGAEPLRGRGPFAPVDRRAVSAGAREALARLEADIDPDVRAGDLSAAARQIVEAAREMSRASLRVLLLDEASAALSVRESEALARLVRSLAARGVGVVLVTHRVREALELADRVTVLREGRVVLTAEARATDAVALAAAMVGEAPQRPPSDAARRLGHPVLELGGLTVASRGDRVRGLSLTVHAGEIVGVAAQTGHGRAALIDGLSGLARAAGRVSVAGRAVRPGAPGEAVAAGLAVVHEDRGRVSLALDESVAFNICFPSLGSDPTLLVGAGLPGGGLPDRRRMDEVSLPLIGQLQIRCSGPGQPVRELSGGNRQKVAVARALAARPRALVIAEPTRGVDIGAREIVWRAIESLAAAGAGVLLVSGDVGEHERLADRVVVLREGSEAAGFALPADPVALELAMLGQAS